MLGCICETPLMVMILLVSYSCGMYSRFPGMYSISSIAPGMYSIALGMYSLDPDIYSIPPGMCPAQ